MIQPAAAVGSAGSKGGEAVDLSKNAVTVLENRYLNRDDDGKVIETPAQLFRRVAHAVAAVESKWGVSAEAIREVEDTFYRSMTERYFMPNSPTLMNAGRRLGMLVPAEYQEMIELSADTGESLDEQERRALPTTHSQVLAHLLAGWQIGPDVFLPLKFAFDEFSSLLRLSEPIRTKAELLKTSILLSRLAVGGWHDWDLLEIPAVDTLKRLRIADPIGVIERAKIDVQKLAAFSPNADATAKPGPAPVALQRVGYCNLGSAPHDLLATLLPSLGLEAVAVNPEEMEHGATAIVNALGAPSRRISKLDAGPGAVLVTSADRLDTMSRFAEAVAIPTSFGQVRECIAGAMSRKEARTSVPSTSWLEKFTSGKSVWRAAAKANSP